MNYRKISPLGKQQSVGTFDDFYSTEKYASLEEARSKNDTVIVDFVVDESGTVYFEFYNTQNPDEKKYHQLNYQHFPAGIDVSDDAAACEIAPTLFETRNL